MAQPAGQDVPAAIAAKLKVMNDAKRKSKMPYWDLLQPVVKWEDGVAHVKLQCHMGCFLTCSNVSQTADRHFNVIDGKLGCKKRVASWESVCARVRHWLSSPAAPLGKDGQRSAQYTPGLAHSERDRTPCSDCARHRVCR